MTDETLIGKHLSIYRIERECGASGIGLMYSGVNGLQSRPVLLTVLHPRYRHNAAYRERFVRDSRTVATWRHPNISPILCVGLDNGTDYVVANNVPGCDLASRLAESAQTGESLPLALVVQIGRGIAAALDFAHHKGIIHRDVTPANIVLGADGQVILRNFGLATDLQASLLYGDAGPTHYIAPEQARSAAAALPQSDVYALGVILAELLVAHQSADEAPIAAAQAVLDKARSPQPADRYPTSAAMMTALEQALGIGDRGSGIRGQESGIRGQEIEIKNQKVLYGGAAVPAAPPAPREQLIGQHLDAYCIEALLGSGGMANVYRGVDVRLKRTVAIKVIRAPWNNRAEHAMRFKREAQAIAQLEHPNIVRLYQYGDANGLLYMAMEYVEGRDLHHLLKAWHVNPAASTPKIMCRIVREICTALDYAHSRGIIHRDVKPSNILIDARGRAVLADFGLVLLTDLGTGGTVFGSPQYVAPEQIISSASAVPQSDLYGMGVILYRMWTGRLPFNDPNPMVLAMQHMSEEPPSPRQIRPDISPALEAVLLKALAKNPADRYASGAALADALERAILGAPVFQASHAVANRPNEEITLRAPKPPSLRQITAPLIMPESYTVSPPKRRRWLIRLLGIVGIV